METLVSKEVEKQLRHLPKHLNGYIDPIDVATYALNRLPPLYASSERGQFYQMQIGQTHFRSKITMTVRQAIAAVQQDPLRQAVPLTSAIHEDYQKALTALENLQALLSEHCLLDGEKLNWENLSQVVKKAFRKVVKPQQLALTRLAGLLEYYGGSFERRLTLNNLVEGVQVAFERFHFRLMASVEFNQEQQE
jgi:hypothetical protein